MRTHRGSRQGRFHGPVRGQIVGMSQAVCLFWCPTPLAFGADFEDVSGDSLASVPQRGAASGYDTRPFAARLCGCLRRCACLVAQTSLLSEQMVRMYRARRWFQHPKGKPPAARSRPDCGDVSGGLHVWCHLSRLRGCLERAAGLSTPTGSRQGV